VTTRPAIVEPSAIGEHLDVRFDLDGHAARERGQAEGAARVMAEVGAEHLAHDVARRVGDGAVLGEVGRGADEDPEPDPDYFDALLERGVFLQFDTCGRHHLVPDEHRVMAIVELLERGWGHRILLSSDRCHQSDLVRNGGLGYAWVLDGFRRMLAAAGVDDATFDSLTRANPLRLLSIGGEPRA